MEIKWSINNLERYKDTGYVYVAHWRCDAVDGDFAASVYATCGWGEGAPAIPYASLTEAQVLAWVWESVDKAATEASLAAQIAEQKAPKTATGVPWAA